MVADNHKPIIIASAAAVSLLSLTFLVYKKFNAKPKSLLERIGGEPAVDAAVTLFYKKMLSDDRVKRFFAKTNMVHQASKQRNFLLYVLDSDNRHKYRGLSMDRAHRRLIKEEGMNDSHFDATAENLDSTLKELGVADDVRNEVMTAVAGLREQVMCRGQWAIDKEEAPKKTLFERLGGDAAVNAAVEKFYKRMLSDPRVARFFKNTNMAKQHQKQFNFMSYAFGAPRKYSGMAMDNAHRRLIKEEGMDDSHFDATKENLDLTLAEMGVPADLRQEVSTAVEGLREQVMCRGQWAVEKPKVEEKKTLFERLGGEPAVNAAVEKFYKRMLSDGRVSRFFKDTNMAKQHQKQFNFMCYAFGAPKKYSGLAMDNAHRRLIEKEGMNDSHFDATKENLDLTLAEMGVPADLRQEVSTAVEGLREQVMCRGQWAKA